MRGNNKPGRSGYFGVTWHEGANRWSVQMRIKGKTTYVGLFDNIIDAAKAFDKKAFKQHKKQANLNFPEDFGL